MDIQAEMDSQVVPDAVSPNSESADFKRSRLRLPDSLRRQLSDFHWFVWTRKLAVGVVVAALVLATCFLTVFSLDRFFDTPLVVRVLILGVTVTAWLGVPWLIYRWWWCHRRLTELALLLRHREPEIGDSLLGAIELADSPTEQTRSHGLCAAAVNQVATTAQSRDFRQAAPHMRLRSWGLSAAAALLLTGIVSVSVPPAAINAWSRLLTPWRAIPRYTFAEVQALPEQLVVPHGEPREWFIGLKNNAAWQPSQAALRLTGRKPITSPLESSSLDADGSTMDNGDRTGRTSEVADATRGYRFSIPALSAETAANIAIGDFRRSVRIVPQLRPELVRATASIQLPDYLERSEPLELDIRSGVLTAVQGSLADIQLSISRRLAQATVADLPAQVEGDLVRLSDLAIGDSPQTIRAHWRDDLGLEASNPFELQLRPTVDQPPTVVARGLPHESVVLDSQQLNFEILASDDFGIRQIGLTWRGIQDSQLYTPVSGEKVLAAGGPTETSMNTPATFSVDSLGISAQPIEVRIWVEDFKDRTERTYSAPHKLFVLPPEEHAVWITNQLSQWHQDSLDVRDQEMQLYEANKRLREMAADELSSEQMQARLRHQATSEAANGRRLSSLVLSGEQLLRQAARNPEIGVGHLDRWAEMLRILNEISNQRMPTVADLLDQAASDSQLALQGGNQASGPLAGKLRSAGEPTSESPAGETAPPDESEKNPIVADVESSMQPRSEDGGESNAEQQSRGGNRMGLAKSSVMGPAETSDRPSQVSDSQPPLEQAVEQQSELLTEFERVAQDLNDVLSNLEGSTLMKRLKAASRQQDQVASRVAASIQDLFGRTAPETASNKNLIQDLAEVEAQASREVAYIMDDIQSYFERRRMNQFRVVLEEMQQSNVLNALRDLGTLLESEQGLAIAQAEFWADTLDRWAEDLVDPACSGACPGCKTPESLPPSVILEVLRILEAEVNLREQTRVADRSKQAVEEATYTAEANRLSEVQRELRQRVQTVSTQIEALPQGPQPFMDELALLDQVDYVMREVQQLLAYPETGAPAIAAETEVIEMLLQSKRINPKGGGSGGSSPGGGGTGTTEDSALALLGSGLDRNASSATRNVAQAVGEQQSTLPAEFRAGLDEYFHQLEQER